MGFSGRSSVQVVRVFNRSGVMPVRIVRLGGCIFFNWWVPPFVGSPIFSVCGVCRGCRLRVNLFYNPFVLTWLTIWGIWV